MNEKLFFSSNFLWSIWFKVEVNKKYIFQWFFKNQIKLFFLTSSFTFLMAQNFYFSYNDLNFCLCEKIEFVWDICITFQIPNWKFNFNMHKKIIDFIKILFKSFVEMYDKIYIDIACKQSKLRKKSSSLK